MAIPRCLFYHWPAHRLQFREKEHCSSAIGTPFQGRVRSSKGSRPSQQSERAGRETERSSFCNQPRCPAPGPAFRQDGIGYRAQTLPPTNTFGLVPSVTREPELRLSRREAGVVAPDLLPRDWEELGVDCKQLQLILHRSDEMFRIDAV